MAYSTGRTASPVNIVSDILHMVRIFVRNRSRQLIPKRKLIMGFSFLLREKYKPFNGTKSKLKEECIMMVLGVAFIVIGILLVVKGGSGN